MKLSLDKAWELCLAQRKWIADEIRAGSTETVEVLKAIWLRDNGFGPDSVRADCFFCEYAFNINPSNCCSCPGRLIDPDFHCGNNKYDHEDKPIEFYEEIVRLNKKRLESQ